MSYIPHTADDVRVMFETIRSSGGPGDMEALFSGIPAACRLQRPLEIPAALDEMALEAHMRELAGRNASPASAVCFLGGGAYDHFVPAVVDQLSSRGEFYTSYTPYQAEASQGNLQVYFEYQSLISTLTGMDISNMSLYDGGSAAAEAVLMALSVTPRKKVLLSSTAHPEYRQVIETYLANLGVETVTVQARGGVLSTAELAEAIDDSTACALLQQPNFFGCIEQIEALTLSDVIAVMNEGRIAQEGPPLDIYRQPNSAFVANFIGHSNLVPGTLRRAPGGVSGSTIQVQCALGNLVCTATSETGDGEKVMLAIRPEHIELMPQGDADENQLQGVLETASFIGNVMECSVRIGEQSIKVQLHPDRTPPLGSTLAMYVAPRHCLALRA